MNPSKHKMSVLSQIFKLIPENLIPKLATERRVDKQARSFSPTSHVASLLFACPWIERYLLHFAESQWSLDQYQKINSNDIADTKPVATASIVDPYFNCK